MEKKKIVMLNVVGVNHEGALDFSLERHETKEAAFEAAEEAIRKWLGNNECTLDENVSDESDGYYNLCDRKDWGDFIQVRCLENIAELNVRVYEFEV